MPWTYRKYLYIFRKDSSFTREIEVTTFLGRLFPLMQLLPVYCEPQNTFPLYLHQVQWSRYPLCQCFIFQVHDKYPFLMWSSQLFSLYCFVICELWQKCLAHKWWMFSQYAWYFNCYNVFCDGKSVFDQCLLDCSVNRHEVVTSEHVSSYHTTAKGPDPSLRRGPNKDLLLYVTTSSCHFLSFTEKQSVLLLI